VPRLILGIESSCDETAAAVVDDRGHVLADVVASQIAVHAPFGGVVPELAARAHLENVVPVIEGALAKIDGGLASIDAIAVTRGPGLNGALLVGIQAAKAMAWAKGIPLVGVDHLEAHLHAVFLRRDDADEARPVPAFPYVALLASGGHTAIYEVRSPLEKVLLGQTRDDAAGEAFDKTAKLLGLGYPGGPRIDALAAKGDASKVAMPRPLMNKTSLEFSFSGLKTAVARHVEKEGRPSSEQAMADLCAAVQSAIVDSLATKAVLACKQRGIRRLVLGGGVAANRGLRARCAELCKRAGVALYVPPVASCTDNGAMIAWAGFAQLDADRIADGTLSPYSRSPDVVRGKVRNAQRQPGA
jgi:N6-L-threonylcarbamoyladenine synthase